MKCLSLVIALLLASLPGLMCGSALAQAGGQSAGSEMPTEAEHSMFVKGQTRYNQGLYGEAIVILTESLETFPNSSIKDLNLLWLGRSYLAQGDMTNAEKTELRLRAIPDTPLLELYEDELRSARLNYAKAVTPAPVRKSEPVTAHQHLRLEADKPQQTATAPKPVPAAAVTTLPVKEPKMGSPSSMVRPVANSVANPTNEKSNAGIVAVNSNGPIDKPEFENGGTRWPVVEVGAALTNILVGAPAQLPVSKRSTIAELPALLIRIEAIPGVSAAIEAFSYRLVITNVGKGIAKDLTVREELDSSLDYVGSDPLPHRQELVAQKEVLTFRLPLIEPGETKVVQISVRSPASRKLNIASQTTHSVIYRDLNGGFYHTP